MFPTQYIRVPLIGFCCFALLVFSGCGPKRPPGLEKTYPCQITLTQGGKPISGARVVLHSKTGTGWTIAGVTNASGTANMVTEFDFKGVPTGTYKVAFVKPPEVDIPKKSREEINALSMEEGRKYTLEYNAAVQKAPKIIPPYLNVASASPIEVTVSDSGENAFAFDLDDYKTPPKGWSPPKH